ncbi:MAG TPA: hypothetical protein VFF11_11345, partial [Candidatus Binatia bacterium]|nr:hypothetical protein [Candidatus Binatia bacterium]
ELPVNEEPALNAIYGEFARIEQAERNTASAISLQKLVSRMPAPAALPEPEAVSEEEPPTDVETVDEPENFPPEEPAAARADQAKNPTAKSPAKAAEAGTATPSPARQKGKQPRRDDFR